MTKSVVTETRAIKKDRSEAGFKSAPPSVFGISPCAYQTEGDIEAYYRNIEEGAVAVVRQTQHYSLRYFVTRVSGTKPSLGRVYVDQHGAFYMKHGKNCFHPKGQTTLVVPTEAVLQWAAEHPRGELDYTVYPPR